MTFTVEENVPLAARTTLELGGSARFFVEAPDDASIKGALAWARARGVGARILGGGSNLVIGDAGVDGLVIAIATRGVSLRADGERTLVEAAAGEPWDALVELTTSARLAGLECLSGIPGLAGATPIQNVGAYGQEVADTIVSVRALDRRDLEVVTLSAADCAFAYRDSALKRDPDRFVVLSVTFGLIPGGPASVRYAELERALGEGPRDLGTVRSTVIALRRMKSMVLDPADPNRRSAGSFFTNPIVDPSVAEGLVDAALASGLVSEAAQVPRWAQPDGRVKLAAGWLIERAGITRGLRREQAGISTKHALALVHHGEGTAGQLLALAEEVRSVVRARFGVELQQEPVLW